MNESEINKHDKKFKSVAIYSRKSKFTGKGESIDNQIEMCKKYLEVNFINEYDDMEIAVFEDEGFSGGNTNRPQFQEMMQRIKNKEFEVLICYRLDRISRNTKDFIEITEILKKYNVDFISMRDKFDTSTPAGRAMLVMVSVFSQLERETIAERIRDNMRELAKTGRWLGGTTPTGYKSVQLEKLNVEGKKKSSYMLEILGNEIETVKTIYSKFMETNSLTQTETFLLNNGFKTKRNKNHSRFSIRGILQNPVYMIADDEALDYFSGFDVEIFADKDEFNGTHGVMAYSKTQQEYGKAHKVKDIEDWIIAVGKHKGIIPGRDWVKVQNMLSQNKSKSYRKPRSHTALLSGVLFCGHCGRYMRPKLTTRKNGSGQYIYNYMCETKEKSRKYLCDMSNINGNILDAEICEEITKLSRDDSAFFRELKKARQSILRDSPDYEKRIREYERKKSDNEKSIQNNVTSLTTVEGITREYITKDIERLHEENIFLTDKIDEIKCLTSDSDLSDDELNILKDTLSSFSKIFDLMTVEEKREAIRAVVRNVVWDGESIYIYFLGSDDDGTDLSAASGDDQRFPLGEDSK